MSSLDYDIRSVVNDNGDVLLVTSQSQFSDTGRRGVTGRDEAGRMPPCRSYGVLNNATTVINSVMKRES